MGRQARHGKFREGRPVADIPPVFDSAISWLACGLTELPKGIRRLAGGGGTRQEAGDQKVKYQYFFHIFKFPL